MNDRMSFKGKETADKQQMRADVQAVRGFVIDNLDHVLKEPVSFIRHPFIDPGSVYDGNVWDWDTFWSVYGLLNLCAPDNDEPNAIDKSKKDKIVHHAQGNVLNFFDHQLPDGYIPMMIEVGEWPEPYLNMKHKEGVLMNMHKPFLCQQICVISEHTGSFDWAYPYINQLELYFQRYEQDYFNKNCQLYVWCDDIMIGMDNDPASFGRPKFSTANIFLNSFMTAEFKAMAKILNAAAKKDIQQRSRAEFYRQKAVDLIAAIQNECWDNRDQFFYSVDVDVRTRAYDWFHQGLGVFWKTLPIKIRAWSGFLPMWAGFASQEQAYALKQHMFDKDTFASDYGITTLAKDEKMFDLSVTNNPSNWLGPIWLVANYAAFRGLLNYGFRDEAEMICARTLRLLADDLANSGSLHEYYDPFTGKPVMNGGFINWNILAVNMYDELHGASPLTASYLN